MPAKTPVPREVWVGLAAIAVPVIGGSIVLAGVLSRHGGSSVKSEPHATTTLTATPLPAPTVTETQTQTSAVPLPDHCYRASLELAAASKWFGKADAVAVQVTDLMGELHAVQLSGQRGVNLAGQINALSDTHYTYWYNGKQQLELANDDLTGCSKGGKQ